MHFVRVAAAHVLTVVLVLAACAVASGSAHADGDAQKGKAAFIKNGCWQCHDFAGEGSIATSSGRVIARTALPLDAFKAFVRTTSGPHAAVSAGDAIGPRSRRHLRLSAIAAVAEAGQ
jgi:hypothetical protein